MPTITPRTESPASVKEMTGRQKAAILCTLVGAEATRALTEGLSPEEIEILTFEIAQIEKVEPHLAQAVLTEWSESLNAVGAVAIGGLEYAKEILNQSFGEQRATAILKRISNQLADSAGLHRLKSADPATLANTLRNEHPQTIAVTLAHLDPAQTAGVIRELGAEISRDVVYRVAKLDKVPNEMLQTIERSLRADGDMDLASRGKAAGGPNSVAAILNLISGALEKDLLDGLAARDASLADQVKSLMFVFEDLVKLDEKSMRLVIGAVDSKTLALSLKGATEELRSVVTKPMAQRALNALKDEMESLGSVRMKDVMAAQSEVVDQVRQLEERGEIQIRGAEGEGDAYVE